MAGGLVKHRALQRKSSHRVALLRNLVESLIEHESIATTWPKAKEAQRIAEKMITHGKRGTEASRIQAFKFFFRPGIMWERLTGPLRERYMTRPGGYTRVLRIEPIKEDQAPSAILELVDGPKDMRFAMTAKTIANLRHKQHNINDMTAANIQKVTKYRPNAEKDLDEMIESFEKIRTEEDVGTQEIVKKKVYPDLPISR